MEIQTDNFFESLTSTRLAHVPHWFQKQKSFQQDFINKYLFHDHVYFGRIATGVLFV